MPSPAATAAITASHDVTRLFSVLSGILHPFIFCLALKSASPPRLQKPTTAPRPVVKRE
jgi:hypothetical protein